MQLTTSYQLLDTKNSGQFSAGNFTGYYISRLYGKYVSIDESNRTAVISIKTTFQLSSNGYWGIYDGSSYQQDVGVDSQSDTKNALINGGSPIYSSTGELTVWEKTYSVSYSSSGTYSGTAFGQVRWWGSSYYASQLSASISLPNVAVSYGTAWLEAVDETTVRFHFDCTGKTATTVAFNYTKNGEFDITGLSGISASTGYKEKTFSPGDTIALYSNWSSFYDSDGRGWWLVDTTPTSVTLPNYPYIKALPDLVIGNDLVLNSNHIYNPLGRTITLELWVKDGTSAIASQSISGTSATFSNATIRQALYGAIPSGSRTFYYYVKAIYSTISTKVSSNGTYYINTSYNLPTLTLQGITRVSDSSGSTEDPMGAYAKVTYDWSISSVDNNAIVNIVHTQYYGTTQVATQTVTLSGTSGTTSIVFACDTDKLYTIRSVIHDTIGNMLNRATSLDAIVPTASMPLSLYQDSDTLAVSLGEQAQDYGNGKYVNFAEDVILRAREDDTVKTKTAFNLLAHTIDDDYLPVIGNAIALGGWNQLFDHTEFSAFNVVGLACSFNTTTHILTYSGTRESGDANAYGELITIPSSEIVVGHKYYVKAFDSNGYVRLYTYRTSPQTFIQEDIWECTAGTSGSYLEWTINFADVPLGSVSGTLQINIIDLTAIFGAGNEPTLAQFKAMFTDDYYPYHQVGGMDLLWTNSSPSSAFAGQTLSLNLANYSRIMIAFERVAGTMTYMECYEFAKGFGGMPMSRVSNYIAFRQIQTSDDNGITFVSGVIDQSGGLTTDNTYMVPYKIYGVR